MTVTVRLSDSITYPEEECLAVWEMSAPPAEGDVLVLGGSVYEVKGRLWRGADEVCCSLSRRP